VGGIPFVRARIWFCIDLPSQVILIGRTLSLRLVLVLLLEEVLIVLFEELSVLLTEEKAEEAMEDILFLNCY